MRQGSITLDRIEAAPNCVAVEFTVGSQLVRFFHSLRRLEFRSEVELSGCSEIASSAFCLALAPICWMTGAQLRTRWGITPEMRACVDIVGRYVSTHYGWRRFDPLGSVVTTAPKRRPSEKPVVFFSGGVDSLAACVELAGKFHAAVHLDNFDVLSNSRSDQERQDLTRSFARVSKRIGIPIHRTSTNLADVILHRALDAYFPGTCSFWYGLQHVHHMATSVAMFLQAPEIAYVAGSASKLHALVGSCAALPAFVDRYVSDTRLKIVQPFWPRIRKIELILDKAPDLLRELRVCYSTGGGTCSNCEKCIHTALMILAAGGDLANTSFPVEIRLRLRRRFSGYLRGEHRDLLFDEAIQGRKLKGTNCKRAAQLLSLVNSL